VTITDEEIRQIRLGRGIPAPHEAPKVSEPVEVALVDGGKRLIALARLHPKAGRVQPTKVLVTG
jgi:hypothetical protein